MGARLSDDRQSVCFTVADTGIGISRDDQGRIFEEFTQVPNAMQSRVKGTGLGLPLCRRLARLLHGEVDVHSELGVGSLFSATLPIYFEERGAAAAAPAQTPIETGLVPVIVIDDEAQARHVMERHLRSSALSAAVRTKPARGSRTDAARAAAGDRARHPAAWRGLHGDG